MSSADASASGSEPALAPDDVSDRTFPTAFRGFDPVEVRAFLGQVADELRSARLREAELRELIEAGGGGDPATAQATLEEAEAAAAATRAKAEEEAGAVVAAAREEADKVLREAKERVSQLGHAATAESARVLEDARQQAQQVVRTKAEEAEGAAVKKIADAEREAASIRVKAREDADAILEAAKERGREMVAEAQAARERMIADLNKRKRAAASQLDQLRTGRDRLLESLRVVRRNLDEITTRLEATEGVAPPVAATPESRGSAADGDVAEPASESGAAPSSTVRKVSTAPAAEARRPPRTSRVVLGELPTPPGPSPQAAPGPAATPAPTVVSTTPQPPSMGTPRIDAPQARATTSDASAPPAADKPAVVAEPEAAPAPQEERKSSALRILRRRSGQRPDTRATPVQVGRDSPGEGIRIIGKDPEREPEPKAEVEAEPAPAVEPAVAEPEPAAAVEPEGVEPEPDAESVDAESVDVEPEAVVVEEPVTEREPEPEPEPAPEVVDEAPFEIPDIAPEDLPAPLRPEEIRPRIEDLFARLRADREQAVAKAREVIGGESDGTDEATVDADREAPEAGAAVEPAAREEPEPAADRNTDRDEHLLQARDVVVDPLVGQLTRRLKRTIQDEQNATLDRLRTSRPRPSADDVLASADTQPAPYRYAALPALEEAARAASAAAPFGAVGVGVDDLAQALAEEIASQIRSKVDRVLNDAAEEDVDLQTASERVSSVYREWKTQRVERVASYYLVAAWSRGTFVATPEGTPMRWIVDDDGPCPDCDDNALAGPTPRGQAYPTGQLHPPAHPGCRCLLVALHG